jgi:3-phosphoshikimate 1-carboxyvinyltransferase
MQISLSKSRIDGRVGAPPSKSYTLRGLMCAALARGQSRLLAPLGSDDSAAACRVLQGVGVKVDTADPRTWKVTGGEFKSPPGELFCGDSAATLRFMSAICSLVPGRCTLTAGPSLAKRPVGVLVEALKSLGAGVSSRGDFPPVVVEGGKLSGGRTALRGDISSQYVSALLLVAPRASREVNISLTTPLESRAYVEMTVECLRQFGIAVSCRSDMREFQVEPQQYLPAEYAVEGDWSSASYLLALGAISGRVEVANLKVNSRQGDKVLLRFLEEMGARVEVRGDSIKVSQGKLKAISVDLNECIDLLPTMGVLAALAEGASELRGLRRARLKESDRVQALRAGLESLSIQVEEQPDKLIIKGGDSCSGSVDSFDDHRIAMAFSLMGVARGNVTVRGAESVSKTFPEYWQVLKQLGAIIHEQ